MVPTDVNWPPITNAAADAEAYVRRVFPDPDGSQEIDVEFCDRITTVDAGQNLQRIGGPVWAAVYSRSS